MIVDSLRNNVPISDADLMKEFHNNLYSLQHSGDSYWRRYEVVESYNMDAGDQWDDRSLKTLKQEGRPVISFNRIHPLINQALGYMVQHKCEARYFPTSDDDNDYVDKLNLLASWAREQGDFDQAESHALRDMLVCGVGVTKEYVDYDLNSDGIIQKKRKFPLHLAWDTAAKEINIRDARWVCCVEYINKKYLAERFPKFEEKLLESALREEGVASKNIEFLSYDFGFIKGGSINGDTKDAVLVYDYQWSQYDTIYRLDNIFYANPEIYGLLRDYIGNFLKIPINDPVWELDEKIFVTLSSILKELEIPFNYSQTSKKRVYQAFIANGVILEKRIHSRPDGFSYNFLTAHFDEGKQCWYGITRLLKDPQRVANSAFLKMYEAVHAIPKGGVIIEEGAVDDPVEFERTYLHRDSVSWVKDGRLGSLRDKVLPGMPTGFETPLQLAIDAFREVSGISLELSGQSNSDIAGILAQQRSEQSVVAIATFFESYKYYQKECARSLVHWLRELAENVDGRLVRIIGEDGQRFERLNRQIFKLQYDVDIEDTPLSTARKAENFKIMAQLFQSGLIPPELTSSYLMMLLEQSQLPQSTVSSLKDNLVTSPEQSNEQSRMKELHLQKMILENERLLYENQKILAEIKEKQSVAIENQAQAMKIITTLR